MTVRAMFAFAAGLAAAGSACAAPVALPCNVPVGKPFTLEIEQDGWTRAGTASRVLITRSLRIEREGQGLLVLLGSPGATSNLTGIEARRLAAIYRPGATRDARIHLDGHYQIVSVEDLDGHWQDYLARIQAIITITEAEGGKAERSHALLAALAKADQATRIGEVGGVVEPFLRQCGQTIDAAPEPDGQTVRLVEHESRDGIDAETSYRVDRASGLVRAIDRKLTPLAQPDKPQVEHWRLEPSAR